MIWLRSAPTVAWVPKNPGFSSHSAMPTRFLPPPFDRGTSPPGINARRAENARP
jgi:hypothetical protein